MGAWCKNISPVYSGLHRYIFRYIAFGRVESLNAGAATKRCPSLE